MKITNIKHFTVHPGWRKNLIYVKVETDEGLVGWEKRIPSMTGTGPLSPTSKS